MRHTQMRSRVIRHAMDFALALVLFMGLTGTYLVSPSDAFPGPSLVGLVTGSQAKVVIAPAEGLAAEPIALRSQPAAPATMAPHAFYKVLLALVFAAMTTFNLALWRHLRRAYAVPKRRRTSAAPRSIRTDW